MVIFILFLMVVLFSCYDADPLLDSNKDLLNTYGEIRSDTLTAISDTFLVGGKVSTASSAKLSLGYYEEYETRFLVKFDSLPPDTAVIDTLRIRITANSVFGSPMAPLEGTVYRVIEEWQESVNANENWDYKTKIDYSDETSANFMLSMDDSATYTIDLPTKLVDIWRDTTSGNQNFGLLFDYNQADHVREFISSEAFDSDNIPQLIYMYKDTSIDSVIQDTVTATKDAALIDFRGTFNPEDLYIASGYTAHVFFEFDFSLIPENSILSSVDFIFTQDSVHSLVNNNRGQGFYLRNVLTEFEQLPYYVIDSTFIYDINYNVLVVEDVEKQLNVLYSSRADIAQNFIQSIINQETPHGSFFIQYTSEGSDISVYALRGKDDVVLSKRPKMILEYYLLPSSRI